MKAKIFVETDPAMDAKDMTDVVFGRDLRICRLDGSLLIPYGFANAYCAPFERRYRAMLPADVHGISLQGLERGLEEGSRKQKLKGQPNWQPIKRSPSLGEKCDRRGQLHPVRERMAGDVGSSEHTAIFSL